MPKFIDILKPKDKAKIKELGLKKKPVRKK